MARPMATVCKLKVPNGIRKNIQPMSLSSRIRFGSRSGRNAATVHSSAGRIRNRIPTAPAANWV
jgi:hypothetical protein